MLPAALLIRPLAQNRLRLLVSVLAIALGVALGYAVHLINRTAVDEFTQALQSFSGTADLSVRGPRSGFDERLYPRLAQLSAVAVASPMLEVQARIAGEDEPLRVVGIDVFRAASLQPALLGDARDSLDTLRPDTVFLSTTAREWLGVSIGSILRVQVGLREVALRVAGWLPAAGTRARAGVMDIAGVQWLLGKPGVLTRIDLKLRPGADVEAVARTIRALVPPGVNVERPDAGVHAATSMTRAYRVNLNVLALVALFTGALLVFSTQALSVVRRRSQLALLRVVGVTRRGLIRLLLAEGALVGAAGAALGVAAGYAVAFLVLRYVGTDLGAGHFPGLRATPRVELHALAVFFLLGVAAALAGSFAPALEAARSPPAQALKAGDDVHAFERTRTAWPGLLIVALGAAAVGLPPIDGLPIFGYIAIALLLIGTIMLMPRAMVWLLARLPSLPGAERQLAHAQLLNAPGPATTSLAAIVAAVGLTVSMAIMVASFRQSVDAWLEHVLPADLYVRAGMPGDTGYFSPEDQKRLADLPGVRRVEFLRSQQILLSALRPPVTLLVRDVTPENVETFVPMVGAQHRPGAGAPPPVWVSEIVADVYHVAPGAILELPIAGKSVRFAVAGVWRDYARQNGAVLVPRPVYVEVSGDRNANDAALWLDAGAAPAELEHRVRQALPGGSRLDIEQPASIRALSLGIFDRSFAATYALEAAAIVIGLFGLSSSVGSQVLARRREFGVLRHIGMTRSQIVRMLATEGTLLSAAGLAIGVLLGWVISLILIYVVNRQSFHWTMDLHIPYGGITLFCAVMLLLATLTALSSGRQAMGGDVVSAVKEDW